jgi:hypothetical protein
MLRSDFRVNKKNDLYYFYENENSVMRLKPWIGDAFSFLYDFIMKSSIFPKKFGGDINKHYEVRSQELKDIIGKHVRCQFSSK